MRFAEWWESAVKCVLRPKEILTERGPEGLRLMAAHAGEDVPKPEPHQLALFVIRVNAFLSQSAFDARMRRSA
jgi:hypothetical protein